MTVKREILLHGSICGHDGYGWRAGQLVGNPGLPAGRLVRHRRLVNDIVSEYLFSLMARGQRRHQLMATKEWQAASFNHPGYRRPVDKSLPHQITR